MCFSKALESEKWKIAELDGMRYFATSHVETNNFSWLGDDLSSEIESTFPGREIMPIEAPEMPYPDFFDRFQGKLSYAVAFGSIIYQEADILARNRQGDIIAGIVEMGRGKVILLPYPDEFVDACFYFVDQVLPQAFPEKFPEKETRTWIKRTEYQTPAVQNMIEEKHIKYEEYFQDLEARQEAKELEKGRTAFLQKLLTAQGNDLKKAVHKTLEYLGCEKLVDVDAAVAEEGLLEEDLRFEYKNEKRLVEVSGSIKNARDTQVNDVIKYLKHFLEKNPGSKPSGILVFNNKKSLPHEDRGDAFSQRQIKDAEREGICLVRTADLFKAVMEELNGARSKAEIVEGLCRPGLFNLSGAG